MMWKIVYFRHVTWNIYVFLFMFQVDLWKHKKRKTQVKAALHLGVGHLILRLSE